MSKLSLLGKTIVISACAHLALFSMFNLSFGIKLPTAGRESVSFWGAYLRKGDLEAARSRVAVSAEKSGFNKIALRSRSAEGAFLPRFYLKPQVRPQPGTDKQAFIEKAPALIPSYKKNRQEITFYPNLPYRFLLYFKDRQTAHIELSFNILSEDGRSTILVRRKVSSGNLEADLLSVRYINHYLFIQQGAFTPDKWQAVKIDLSAKDD